MKTVTLIAAALSALTWAHPSIARPAYEVIVDTQTGEQLTLEQAAARMNSGEILVFGEEHATAQNEKDPGNVAHHDNQARWLEALSARADIRSRLGMEFLEYPDQPSVDAFLNGKLTEAEFLKQVRWGGNPFAPYGRLMQISRSGAGTAALNIPRGISRQVSRGGKDSLSDEQKKFLPPIWERGGAEYFERFHATMAGHVPEQAIDRYFWAQSLWDDTMAWQALAALEEDLVLTLIVGQFHADFGHGLPARLKRQGAPSVRTMIQVQVENWEAATIAAALEPDAKYGHRADFIWLYVP